MANDEGLIAIYSRKSRFTGKGESIGNQVELCRDYIRNVFGKEEGERCVVFEDEGFSGGNLKRPDFLRMMEGVRRRRFRAVVVYRLDRISRNISDFTGLIDELTKLNVSFISIREQFDTGTPMGRAMMFIISVFSQLERETIAERIRDNMRELAKTGRWLGGNAPIGYRSGAVSKLSMDGKERKSYMLIPVPEEIEIPRLIFELYTERDSLTAVEAELLRQRIKTKRGNAFTRFAIKGILQNPVYMVADEGAYDYFDRKGAELCFPREAFDGSCGIMAYNRTDQEKGKTTRLLPVSQWIIALGKHPGCIPSEQWICVQASLERNRNRTYRKARSNQALLTGLIFCACGERMYPKLSQRNDPSGERIYSYVCRRKERSRGQGCSRRNANGNLLDAAVMEQIKLQEEDGSVFCALLEKSRDAFCGMDGYPEKQLQALRGEHAENERKLDGLMDSLGMAGDPAVRDRILRRIEELLERNRDIGNRVEELEDLAQTHALDDGEMERLGLLLSSLAGSIAEMSVEEKRNALRATVDKVVWDGTRGHVVLAGAEEKALWDAAEECKEPWGEDSK